MKVTMRKHPQWGLGNNVVAVLPPSHGDLFADVLIEGKLAMSYPITEYDRAVNAANWFARHVEADRPVVIKVLCLSAREAETMFGFSFREELAKETPWQAWQTREAIRTSCISALRTSNDPKVRADAMEVLQGLGELQDMGVTA